MDTNDAIVFKNSNSDSATTFFSPGNNPFDNIWKKTLDAVSASEQINRRSSIQLPANISNTLRQSLSFSDLNSSGFGRESIGILPPDFGRDSLGFLNVNTLEVDRDSLGIIQINSIRESLSFQRESLGILNFEDLGRESLDCGRESLGILHLRSPDLKFQDEGKRIPDILLSTIDENTDVSSNILDTAFLQIHSRRSSDLSNFSSINPSFNSESLDGPSRIYSLPSFRNDLRPATISNTSNFSNSAYSSNSALFSLNPLNKGNIFSPNELEIRSRIKSMPVTLKGKCSHLNGSTEFEDQNERKFWSVNRTTTYLKSLARKSLEKSFQQILDFKEGDISNEFLDSVFIEGNLLAEKIADGSILNDSTGAEVGILDSTPQPNWPEDLSYIDNKDKECQKYDTETIFKTVDRMLPAPVLNTNSLKLKNCKGDSNSSGDDGEKINTECENNSKSSQIDEQNVSKLLHNMSDIQHESKKSVNGKGPKEILQNLSELLNSTSHSDKQKSEGQILLNSLANILCQNKSSVKSNLDDSGHSSINEQLESSNKENYECFEVLDLRAKSVDGLNSKESSDRSMALDLSLKLKPTENLAQRRFSQSLCSTKPHVKFLSHTGKRNASVSSIEVNKNKTAGSSVTSNDSNLMKLSVAGSSVTSNDSNSMKLSASGKLRQKSYSNNSKRGPLKAIIPVDDMKKKNNTPNTPEKIERKMSIMQLKRTSTPINESKLKPVAASTPTTESTKESPRYSKGSKSNPVSLLKGSKKSIPSSGFTQEGLCGSTLPKYSTLNMDYKLRRNSVSDIRKTNESVSSVRRRNSVEKGSGITSSVVKARQNTASLQTQKQKIENKPLLGNKGKFVMENKHFSVTKSSNLEPNCKASAKVAPNDKRQNMVNTERSSKAIPSPIKKTKRISSYSPSHVKTVRNKGSDIVTAKRNSFGNDSGIMSSLAKIRQNMLESPHFHLNKEDVLNKNYVVLSENKRLGKSAVERIPQLKKYGKENVDINRN